MRFYNFVSTKIDSEFLTLIGREGALIGRDIQLTVGKGKEGVVFVCLGFFIGSGN